MVDGYGAGLSVASLDLRIIAGALGGTQKHRKDGVGWIRG